MKKLISILLLNLMVINLINAQCSVNFIKAPDRFSGGNGSIVDLGDIDNDGDIDVITDIQNYDNKVYKNFGNAFFISDNQTLGLTNDESDEEAIKIIRLGDINNDNQLDIIMFYDRDGTTEIRILSNFGNGNFVFSGQQASINEDMINYFNQGKFKNILELVDLDNDNDLDILMAINDPKFETNYFMIWNNDGYGNFTAIDIADPTTTYIKSPYDLQNNTNYGASFRQIIDYDMDGDKDFFIYDEYFGKSFILYNNSNGTYSYQKDLFFDTPNLLFSKDYNFEMKAQIGDSIFNQEGYYEFILGDSLELEAIYDYSQYDFDNDGNYDTVNVFTLNSSYLDGIPNGMKYSLIMGFDTIGFYNINQSPSILGDFDNDNDIDILLPTPRALRKFGYYIEYDSIDNDVTISFGYFKHLNEEFEVWYGMWLDQVAAGTATDSVNILLLNDGNNNYDSLVWFGGSNENLENLSWDDLKFNGQLQLEDINYDGSIDLISYNFTSYSTNFLLNNGSGEFYLNQTIPTYGGAVEDGEYRNFILKDINQDGYLDYCDSKGGDTISIYINDNNGNLNLAQNIYAENSLGHPLFFEDLDNDGDLDIFEGRYQESPLANIYLNGIQVTVSPYAASCVNDCNGSATVLASNGIPPYTYQWNDPLNQTTSLATNLCTGDISVTVTDNNGCSGTANATIEQTTLSEPNICVVSVDSTSTRNVVVWQKPFTQNIDFYSVYRELSSGFYSLVGIVPYDSLSQFTDNTLGINPNVTSYRYKLSYTDTCGNESPMSNFHETIHLSTNLAPNGGVNLIWDGYEGIPLSYYRILRDSSYTNTWEVLDSVTNNVFIWTDANPPTNGAQYLIEVVIPYTCTSTKSVDHNTTRSNRGTVAGGGLSPEAYFAANQTQINIGGVVDFYDQSSFNPTAWYWYLPGGTPGFSTQRNPSNIIYNTAGNFDVTLVVQNSLGLDTLIKSEYIQVYTGTELYPQCDFMASNNLIEEGNSINFLDLSENNPTSWTWFFEGADPSFSTQQNPTGIYYASPGYYDVTLIANNPSGSDTLIQTAFIEVYSQNEPIADFAASITEVAVGSSVDFVDITQNNPTSWTWFFPGANPAVSVDENPSNIVYNTIGTFDVTLVTSNPSGTDTIIKTNYIHVVDATAPSCDFIANNTTINQASSIDFADLTQNNPTSWTWLFPGGNPAFSTLQNPTNIAYDSVGTFDVTLIATNSNGNDTLVKENYIQVLSVALPSSDFMAGSNTITEGQSVDFIDLTQNNPTSWTWLFEGGNPSISNEQNPLAVQYNTIGTFDVTLITVNDNGTDTIVKSNYITVTENQSPVSNFMASDSSFAGGSYIDFLDLSTNNPTSWTWFFDGGNPSFSTQQNPTGIYYASPGYYDVTLITNNPSGSDTLIQTAFIEVYSQNEPIADFAASITEVAVGSSVDFVDITQNNPTSWTWFFPGANPAVSVDENPSNIVYNTIGTFDVTLVTSNPSGTDTIIKTNYIHVVDATAPSCDFIANNTTINQASSIDFADLTQNNPTSWTWLFPGGNPAFSTLQNPTNIAYDSVGTFDVTLIATNSNGNDTLVKENYIQVLSVALPSSDFMAGSNTITEGQSVDFIDLTQNNPTSWTWLFEGGNPSISNEQNPLAVQYNTIGTFDVTLITVNDNGTDTIVKSNYITVTENQSPVSNFMASDSSFAGGSYIDFLDLSTNNPTSWTWFFDGGNPSFSTQQNPSQIFYETFGSYDVTLIAENSFGVDTIVKPNYIEVTSSVGINNNIEKEITIYPNPTENTITVDLASTKLPVQLSLTDLSGRTIQKLNAVDSKLIIDLSKFSKGVYFLKVSSLAIQKEIKIIKK